LRDNISLMMPHEMRTPLNGILSNAELLAISAATLKPGEIAEMGRKSTSPASGSNGSSKIF
jgi:two-component system sensor histidine kinase/response regulator